MAVSCSRVPDELIKAEVLMESQPDSALHLLRRLSPRRYNSGESRALYGLLLIRALDKKMLPLKPDSVLDYSLAWYEENHDHDRLAACYLYKGRVYKYASQYEKAMNYYLKALDEAKNLKTYTLLGRINSDMGDIYNIQGDYNAARKKYQQAYTYYKNEQNSLFAFYALLNIARTYQNARDNKNSHILFQKILHITKDSIQRGDVFQEIGLDFYQKKQLDSALKYLSTSAKHPFIGINRSIRYSYLADIYYSQKHYDSAFYYAKNAFRYEIGFRTQRECYRIMTNCEFLKGNTQNVTFYMNKYVALGDSLRKIESQTKGSYMETTHIAQKEAAKSKYLSLYLGILSTIILITAYFLYRFISRRNKKEKKQLHESHFVEKVGIHKKVIDDKRTALQKQINARKEAMSVKFKNASLQERELQLQNIYRELLHYDDPELFFAEMDKLLNRLVAKLKNKYSTLTEKEIMLCCYMLLHIPTYDMLILFGYKSDDSLKSFKRRLPKKFNLRNVTLLEDFLLAVLSEN